MLDKFTETAKQLVANARIIAESNKHAEIRNEHLLQAITASPDSLAWKLIVETNTPWVIIQHELDSIAAELKGQALKVSGFDEFFKKTVERSMMRTEESGLNWISSGTLLLGILESGSPISSKLLASWGLDSQALIEKIKKEGEIGPNENINPVNEIDLRIFNASQNSSEDLIRVLMQAQEISKSYKNPEVNYHHLLLSYVFLTIRNVIAPFPLDLTKYNIDKTKTLVANKLGSEIQSTEAKVIFSKDVVETLKIAAIETSQFQIHEVGTPQLALAMSVVNPGDFSIATGLDYVAVRRAMNEMGFVASPGDSQPIRRVTEPLPTVKITPIPQISLRRYNADKGAVITIPQKLAEEWNVLALNVTPEIMTVAMVDPENREIIQKLQEMTRLQIAVIKAEERDLKAAFKMNY